MDVLFLKVGCVTSLEGYRIQCVPNAEILPPKNLQKKISQRNPRRKKPSRVGKFHQIFQNIKWSNESTGEQKIIRSTWNLKHLFITGCFNWMIPNLYIGNGCFTKHPFKTGCLGYQEWVNNEVDNPTSTPQPMAPVILLSSQPLPDACSHRNPVKFNESHIFKWEKKSPDEFSANAYPFVEEGPFNILQPSPQWKYKRIMAWVDKTHRAELLVNRFA